MTQIDTAAPSETEASMTFADLGLSDAVLKAVREIGYETPSAIQSATIPHLLAGRDVVGLAQTGTGKTAAFALPAAEGRALQWWLQQLGTPATRKALLERAHSL